MKQRSTLATMELPQGYTYRFAEIDGKTKLVGIKADANPIVIETNENGEFEIKEIKYEPA